MMGPTDQSSSDTLLSDGVLVLIAALLLLAFLLAVAVAPLLRRFYGRRVLRLMGLNQVAPGPVSTASGDATQSPGHLPLSHYGADALTALTRQRQQRIIRATMLAWLTFAVIAPLVAGVNPKAGLGGRLFFFVVAAVLALGPALTNLPEGWTQWSLANVFPDQATHGQVIGKPLWQWIPPRLASGGAYLALWYRRLRGQVVPVFLLFAFWLLLFFGIYAYFESRGGEAWLTRLDDAQEGSRLFTSFQLLINPVWAFFVWVAFRLLGGLARLIRRGWVGELSLGGVVSLMTIAIIMVAEADERHGFWSTSAPLLWVAAAVGVYILALGRPQGDATGPQLLVLRVFSRDAGKHALLDELQDHWRYVGPVQEIGGPDMVDLNVDPYEALMFLSNRLHELFLPAAPSLAQLKALLRTAPDREGRYSINEVFCFNTSWRSTVEQLIQLSDAIVLDVRGLTTQKHKATGDEIGFLARKGVLAKVVAVVDDSTDWPHVESLLRAEGTDPGCLLRLNIGNEPQSQELFTKLLHATSQRMSA